MRRSMADAWTELFNCDRVIVALALDHADWLEEFGYTLAEAVEAGGHGVDRRYSADRTSARRGRNGMSRVVS
jgi:hypothetical protein